MQSKPEASHEHRNRARISVSSPEGIESMVIVWPATTVPCSAGGRRSGGTV